MHGPTSEANAKQQQAYLRELERVLGDDRWLAHVVDNAVVKGTFGCEDVAL